MCLLLHQTLKITPRNYSKVICCHFFVHLFFVFNKLLFLSWIFLSLFFPAEVFTFEGDAKSIFISKTVELKNSEIININSRVYDRGLGLGGVFVHRLSTYDVASNALVISLIYVLFCSFLNDCLFDVVFFLLYHSVSRRLLYLFLTFVVVVISTF